MSAYPSCKHGFSDPNGTCRECAFETELAEAKETIRLLTTDVNYVGGIQYWQKKCHEALVAGVLALREARSNAFEEAAEMVHSYIVDVEHPEQDKIHNDACSFIRDNLRAKANRIRKGEEK